MKILDQLRLLKAENKKALAVLIDPDTSDPISAGRLASEAEKEGASFILLGGSLVLNWSQYNQTVQSVKANCSLPTIIFPGNVSQVDPEADGILFLSLISGRNPEMLIGKHVEAAPMIKASGIEVISTGYMLIGEGRTTSVEYMSQTLPIPPHKPDIAIATAIAGEMLGLSSLYLEAGSGADAPVPPNVIKGVRKHVECPLIVGGGIRSGETAYHTCKAGADLVVVGTAFEDRPGLLKEIVSAVKQASGQPA